jgi:uncharacterized protein YbcV (DUF1398 family)
MKGRREVTSGSAGAVELIGEALARAAAERPAVGGFPQFADSLRRAGIRRNRWYVPAALALYETEAGPAVMQGASLIDGAAPIGDFDPQALVVAIRADQAGESTFPEFLAAIWAAGVFEYEVDFTARSCTYFGADRGERYVERYPAA